MERFPRTIDALTLFWQHCALAGFSPHTIESYRARLRRLCPPDVHETSTKRPRSAHIEPVSASIACPAYVHEIDRAYCSAYLASELEGHSLGTVRTTWAALASFCRFGVSEGWFTESPMRGLPCPREPIDGRYLSRDELRRLWDAAGATGRRYKPDELRLILMLLMEGLRAAELCGIRWGDVREGVLTVRGKGRKVRRIPLSEATLALLQRRDQHVEVACVFAFSTRALGSRIRRLGRKAGIAGMHPHLLRHSWASHFLLEGGNTLALQQLGGWASTEMISARYAKAAMEEAAIRESRRIDLTKRLLDP